MRVHVCVPRGFIHKNMNANIYFTSKAVFKLESPKDQLLVISKVRLLLIMNSTHKPSVSVCLSLCLPLRLSLCLSVSSLLLFKPEKQLTESEQSRVSQTFISARPPSHPRGPLAEKTCVCVDPLTMKLVHRTQLFIRRRPVNSRCH